MTARSARKRRDELEAEIKAAATVVLAEQQAHTRANSTADALTAERQELLSAAARGQVGASERADELRGEIAQLHAAAREAQDRADAASKGQHDARWELNQHLVEHLHVFAGDADKLADAADKARSAAIVALQAAVEADGAPRREWAELAKACNDRRVLGSDPVRNGATVLGAQPERMLEDILNRLREVPRPEPANAEEARKSGILQRTFTTYRDRITGRKVERVRRGSDQEQQLTSKNNHLDFEEFFGQGTD